MKTNRLIRRSLWLCAALCMVVLVFTGCDDGNGNGHTHQWGGWAVTTFPTCTAEGEETRVCSLDPTHKETQAVAIDPNAHDWEWDVETGPTCTEPGEGTGTCKHNANHTTIQAIPIDPNEHTWGGYTQTTPPTCTQAGIRTRACTHDPSHIDPQTQAGDPPLGHDYGSWTQTTSPTCTEPGEETGICTHDTNHTTTQAIPIDPNAHNYVWTVTTPASILAEGVETLICSHNPSHTNGTRTIPKSSVEMVQIPAGTFTMGSPMTEPGRYYDETQHQVTLTSGFYMGKYQVTQKEFREVMGILDDRTTTTYGKGDNYPIYYVNWYDAIVFCNKLSMMEGLTPAYCISGSTDPTAWGAIPISSNATWNAVEIVAGSTGYRLRTEAQWEYACRAGTTTGFNWDTNTIISTQANYDASHLDFCNLVAGIYLERASEVGSYAPNAWGLYDMHGNVWEWCWDWYGSYVSGAQTDPTGAVAGTNRVERGGSWFHYGRYARSALRGISNPGYRGILFGFRVVRP